MVGLSCAAFGHADLLCFEIPISIPPSLFSLPCFLFPLHQVSTKGQRYSVSDSVMSLPLTLVKCPFPPFWWLYQIRMICLSCDVFQHVEIWDDLH